MKLRTLTRTYLLEAARIDPAKAPRITNQPIWTPVLVMGAGNDPDKTHLVRSIKKEVDDNGKKGCFLVMVQSLFEAIALEDFGSFYAQNLVEYKTAFKFDYKNSQHHLKELKRGKKDRIYVYPYTGKLGRLLFVLEVAHKNQMQTAPETKKYAEDIIKEILDSKLMVFI
ncbi:hypothetical protein K0P33_27530 [Pseudomonas sp. ArH3a]|uniref:hypothetical protein n=1 Tax=Pseudomonas sp. ArH3a TaxID=2862945 RepID=UPI001F57F47A|nr:hypothetical protein [Pseudomonas sp. ArH3a]UNM19215.1 hypothetical protein K0P33_27530 [Pseudomonas sp. ArH3a]